MENFKALINQFRNGEVGVAESPKLAPEERYASYDYCFTYFYSNRENPKNLLGDNLQLSCLNLGFYLASWGMYRGSSFILQKSLAVYIPIIELVASEKFSKLWGVDVNNYTNENIKLILDFKQEIIQLPHFKDATDTLITKIMLGVYGCVPAFDTYFKKGIGVSTLNENSLEIIYKFYNDNINEIQSIEKIKCYNFNNADGQDIYYTIAKLIDMYGFQLGKTRKKNKKIH